MKINYSFVFLYNLFKRPIHLSRPFLGEQADESEMQAGGKSPINATPHLLYTITAKFRDDYLP